MLMCGNPSAVSDRTADVGAEVHALLREVDAPDGVHRIVSRLARRLNCSAALIGPNGAVLGTLRKVPRTLLADLTAVADGRIGAVSATVDGRPTSLLPLFGMPPHPVLVARRHVGGEPFAPADRVFLSQATVPLGIAWRVREVRLLQRRLEQADARNREAILHLLQAGSVAGARRAASALGPDLPTELRIHLVESVDTPVSKVLRWCRDMAGRSAWAVRCPVHTRQIVVVARADADGVLSALRARAASEPGFYVGSSQHAPLTEFGSAYRRARHALSIAHHRPDRHAGFHSRDELADILTGIGAQWANETLAPLLTYRPARPQDPNSEELQFTLGSWLAFGSLATRHLKIHRNTLAARLRLIGSVLRMDLDDVKAQAQLHLALQLAGPSQEPRTSLAEMLSRPEVRYWAERQIERLRGVDPALRETLRTWLNQRANIADAAAVLGISGSGVRRRITRIERLIQRSLLDSPPTRHDLFFALAVADGAAQPW